MSGYTNRKDWCDDCCWQYPVHGGRAVEQLHTWPCDCVCHLPSRIMEAANMILAIAAASARPAPSLAHVFPEDA